MQKSPARWWDASSALLLFIAVTIAALRLQSTNWTDGLGYVLNVAVLGLLIGLALGQSKFQTRAVVILSLGYMIAAFISQWLGFIRFSGEELFLETTYLGDRLLILGEKLFASLADFVTGSLVDDPLFLIVLLSIPYWLVGLFSGFQLTRHGNVLASILPGGVMMFIIYLIHYTTRDYNWLFAAYLFIALLLISRQQYIADKRQWSENRVQVPKETSVDMNSTAILSAAILITIAWALPYILPFHEQGRENWQRIQDEWLSPDDEEVFTFINREAAGPSPYGPLRTELALGSQTPQSDGVVFVVTAPIAVSDVPRLYWRGYAYDRFEDGQWQSTQLETATFRPQDGDLENPVWNQRVNLTFTFTIRGRGLNIFLTPPQPAWVNRNAKILFSQASADEQTMDVMIIQASPVLEAGDSYRVRALLANPTASELQEAGDDYPEWVAERYLQLPDGFSPRIEALAREIASAYDNPYDQSVAITNYLRNEIEYVSEVTIPEGTADALEYFLFESKQGFCNYYASTEVLMLRSLGIPARLAVGYAEGQADDSELNEFIYIVRERDFHAWPEVYFPGYGWIEFEPTGNQEPLERLDEREGRPAPIPDTLPTIQPPLIPEQEQELPPEETGIEETAESTVQIQVRRLGLFAMLLLLATIIVFAKRRYAPNLQPASILIAVIERSGWHPPAWLNRWLAWIALSPIEKYFQSINVSLHWMGKYQPPHATAAERAEVLQKLLPSAVDSIRALLTEHQTSLYSPNAGDELLARRAAWDIIHQTIRVRLKTIFLGYN